MIIWENLGTTSGEPTINIPSYEIMSYELDVFSYGSHQLWCGSVRSPRGLTIGRDHFLTQEEAFDFVVSMMNLLELKHPDAVCSNFSFLTKE